MSFLNPFLLFGSAALAIPVLIRALIEWGPLSAPSATAIGEMGAAGPDALRALGQALENGDYRVKIAVAEAIRRLGGDVRQTVPALIDCLSVLNVDQSVLFSRFRGMHEAACIRAKAAAALGQLGNRAADARAALGDLLDDEFITVREAAASALLRID